MSLSRQQIIATIKTLNSVYGKGDLRETRFFLDGRIECRSSLQYGQSHFTARVVGNTVYARGHQRTIKK